MLNRSNMLWRIALLAVLAAVALFLAACSSNSAAAEPEAQSSQAVAQDAGQSGQEDPMEDDDDEDDSDNVDYGTVTITETDFMERTLIYSPATQPALFVECVDNPYFPLIPGTVYHLEEQTDEGLETVTITVTNETKEIMGIQATVVRDTVQVDDQLAEDTWDWFAQDDRGNAWYLGEETREYEDGEVVSTSGSWEAGVDGAVPGIIMPGHPRPGDLYYQEYYEGEAEDMGAIMSLSEQVTVAYGSFANAVQTAGYNPLDEQLENKWYAPGVGLVKEIVVGDSGSVELVSVSHDSSQINLKNACGRNGGVRYVGTIPAPDREQDLEQMAQITAEQAADAAQTAAGGAEVNDTRLTVISGFLVYRVQLNNDRVVTVDAGDGAVLAIHDGTKDEAESDD